MTSSARADRRSFWARYNVAIVALLCVILYILFVQYMFGWRSVLGVWRSVGLLPVASALLLLVSTYLVRTWRLRDYFPGEARGRFVELFRLAQVHNVLNIMLPFRSGETSFPILMRSQFGVPLLRGTSALLVMRLLDLHALLGAAGVGLVLGAGGGAMYWMLWLAFLVMPLLAFTVKDPVLRFVLSRFPGRLSRLASEVAAGLPSDYPALLRAWAMTVLNWGVKVVVLAWVLALMGVEPLAAGFGGALGGELSSVLPLHAPGGVGTYPAGITAGALSFGAPARDGAMETLMQASLNLHLLMVVSALAGLGISLLLSALVRPRAGDI